MNFKVCKNDIGVNFELIAGIYTLYLCPFFWKQMIDHRF